jgi:pimeloyl-ACP methyl ester carboxylesterase
MTPLYIDGCFGILHQANGPRGVLICGPLSDEALNGHRALVFLGEQLAEAGFPALRLAYYGTGDSSGTDDEPGRFAQWLDSITAGADWLRVQCGVSAVTLIGHRVGGSLAARAACDLPAVDSLVLLSPVSGRQFVHELTIAARISQRVWKTSHKVDDGTWFESHGLRIDRATRDALNALDPRKLPVPPVQRALVIGSAKRPAARAVVEALQQSGVAADFSACEQLDGMQRDSYEAEVPHVTFARVLDWMHALSARRPAPHAAPAAPVSCPDLARAPTSFGAACNKDVRPLAKLGHATNEPADRAAVSSSATLPLACGREMPVRFGPAGSLFGILTIPDQLSPDAPAMLLTNTSANPRAGNARVAVDIARGLAADGLISLRMDASGMGDADPRSGERGRPYSNGVTDDVLSAVAELEQRAARPVVVLGICSGAYHALQAAARDHRVLGLVLVNLQRFVWNEGDPSDVVRRSALRPNRFYLQSIFSLQAWYRLLRADFDVANLIRVFSARLLRRALAELDPVLQVVGGGTTRVGRVRREVRALGQRGVAILYVLGSNDPGIEELAEYFGPDGRRLRRVPGVTLQVVPDADHTLGACTVRAGLIAAIRDWQRQAFPGRSTLPTAAERRVAVEDMLVATGN